MPNKTPVAEEHHLAGGSITAVTARSSQLPELKQSEALLIVFNLAVKPGHGAKQEDLAVTT